MTNIQIKNFSFRFNKNIILSDINLHLQSGTFNLLIGPSGSGKSTFLKSVAGLLPQYGGDVIDGDILLNDVPVSTLKPFERAQMMSYVFQNPERQFSMQTPREEMIFALENIQVSPSEISKRINQMLDRLQISDLADQRFLHLSGGEKQKVALALALIMDSDIILLDEPFANIDPKSRQHLIRLLKQLQAQYNKTIIISDHDLTGYDELVEFLYKVDPSNQQIVKLSQFPSQHVMHYGKDFFSVLNPDGNLSWDNLTIQTGTKNVLVDDSFVLPHGQLGLLSGDNGAGKSTLFKTLAQIHPYTGAICWKNKENKQIKPKEWAKYVGLVFQNATDQFVTSNVHDEIELARSNSLHSDYWTIEKIQNSLKELNVSKIEQSNVYHISGGQQKKIQVLTSLIMGQPVLLLDEPLAGLDTESVDSILKLIKQVMTDLNLTILMISHQRGLLYQYIDYEIELSHQTLNILHRGDNDET